MDLEVLYIGGKGKKFTFYGIVINEGSPVKKFIYALTNSKKIQMTALINRILEYGPPLNEEKFRSLGDGIYELKTRSGARILCFWGQNSKNTLVLTHGFFKCKPKRLEAETRKALRWYKEYQLLIEK